MANGSGKEHRPLSQQPAYAFWLVLVSIITVTAIFIVVMAMFRAVFWQDAALILAGMTSAFTVIGTLVGTYFGIKAGRDMQEQTLEKVPSPPQPGQPQPPAGQPQSPAGQPQSPVGQPQSPVGQPQSPAGQPQSPAGQPQPGQPQPRAGH